ncbi:MAG: UvrD-helicase domain-containing protein, partial [Anaerolineae bacterium]|nr:UvrD-helicase domain-containing protein [Anaerolineae bacterium]
MGILDGLRLNARQLEAATAPGDVVVTAGAGSGKTRTLVGRYLALLDADVPLRTVVAITFTEKAAREMRTRIRQAIVDWLEGNPPRRTFWEDIFVNLDAARIGTIHSLCAQMLREHPVEAAHLEIMPGFDVLEEGLAAALRARAVDEALAWAAGDETASNLFGALGESKVRAAVATLLGKRLDADTVFARIDDDPLETWTVVLHGWLAEQLDVPAWQECLATLDGIRSADPTDKMEIARQDVLAHAEAVAAAREQGDFHTVWAELAALRKAMSLGGRKGNWSGDDLETAREAMRVLRDWFDDQLASLADPQKPATWALDERAAGLIWPLHAAYRHAVEHYARAR